MEAQGVAMRKHRKPGLCLWMWGGGLPTDAGIAKQASEAGCEGACRWRRLEMPASGGTSYTSEAGTPYWQK